MFQNIKVDIIYYLTNTDFEMEFNLCGCCRMRLLTDKAADRKGLVHLLARAVSRSRVIIACGSLFGESGLISSIAQSIRRPLAVVDNRTYGISDDNEIKIIKGAMPLVTPEGYFGGCIIESGPQTIILLTENKNIRKTIMSALIHPYIEELSIIPAEPSAPEQPHGAHEIAPEVSTAEPVLVPADQAAAEALDEPVVADSALPETDATPENNAFPEADNLSEDNEAAVGESTVAAREESSQTEEPLSADEEVPVSRFANKTDDRLPPDAKTELSSEHNIPFVLESDRKPADPPAEHNSNVDLYVEPQRVKYNRKSYYETDYSVSEKDGLFYSDNADRKKHPSERRSFNTPILILSIVLLLSLAVLAYLLIYLPMRDGYGFSQFIHKIFNGAVTVPLNLQFMIH